MKISEEKILFDAVRSKAEEILGDAMTLHILCGFSKMRNGFLPESSTLILKVLLSDWRRFSTILRARRK